MALVALVAAVAAALVSAAVAAVGGATAAVLAATAVLGAVSGGVTGLVAGGLAAVGTPAAGDVGTPAGAWPIPSARNAAIIALTKVFSRIFGRSSSSWSCRLTGAVGLLEVPDTADVGGTGMAPAHW